MAGTARLHRPRALTQHDEREPLALGWPEGTSISNQSAEDKSLRERCPDLFQILERLVPEYGTEGIRQALDEIEEESRNE